MTEIENPEEVIDRLMKEIRQLRTNIDSIRQEVQKAKCDLHLLTTSGAIRKLVSERNEALERVRALEKELEREIRRR